VERELREIRRKLQKVDEIEIGSINNSKRLDEVDPRVLEKKFNQIDEQFT
jgi:hypothetical protein